MTHQLSSVDISIFQRKSTTFVVSRNIDKDFLLIQNFYYFLAVMFLKVVVTNTVAILMISANLATLGPLKIKGF